MYTFQIFQKYVQTKIMNFLKWVKREFYLWRADCNENEGDEWLVLFQSRQEAYRYYKKAAEYRKLAIDIEE